MRQQVPATPGQIASVLRAFAPDWRMLRTWRLPGAMSAQVTAIEVEQPDGQRATLVLRQYGAANLRADPRAADTEYRLLSLLSAAGLPVPRPYYADESCAFVAGPCLLQEFIDGEPVDEPADLAPYARQLAATLAALHSAGIARDEVPFLADVRDTVARTLGTGQPAPDEYLRESAVLATLTANWPPAQLNQPVVLHGDFWPGNVLWHAGQVTGVVDWEDALFGDPLADLGITRLELGWLFGPLATRQFTREYLRLRPGVDTTMLPLWDLGAALRASAFQLQSWGMTADKVTAMRAALRKFIGGAFDRLGSAGPAGTRETA